MHLKAAVVEDDIKESNKIKHLLDTYSTTFNDEIISKIYNEPLSILEDYKNGTRYDILFLDVEMPHMDGLALAETIRKNWDKTPYIVFISSYPKYMAQSFNVRAFNYLTKPVHQDIFFDICHRIFKDYAESHTVITMIDLDDSYETITSNEIVYIESAHNKSNYVCLHLIDRIVDCRGSLANWYRTLTDFGFIQCFRSIIVNINYIHYIDNNTIVLTNGEHLPLSRSYKATISKSLLNKIKIFRRI